MPDEMVADVSTHSMRTPDTPRKARKTYIPLYFLFVVVIVYWECPVAQAPHIDRR